MTQDVDSLNPFTGITVAAFESFQLMYDTLTGYAQEDFGTVPGLAEEWTVSDDGLTWTFDLREGVEWSDGEPLTAHDVAYTVNRVLEGEYEQTTWGNFVAAIETAEATDDHTFVVTLTEPTPVMYHLSIPVLPEHVWSEIDGEEVADYANEPEGGEPVVGSGPFLLTEVRKGQFLRYEANEDYWAGAPVIDELVFRIFTSQDSLAQALQRGEIDYADNLEANVWQALEGAEGITTQAASYPGFNEIGINTGAALDDGTPLGDGHPALTDVRVRQAIAHAIDTGELLERVYGGLGEPGTTVIPPMYPELHLEPDEVRGFDPDEARRLLDEAGWTEGPDGVRVGPDGEPLSLRLHGRTSARTSQRTVEFVEGWLEDVGIDVQPELVSEDALTELIGQGTFDLFEWGWVVDPDPDFQLSTFTCAARSYDDGGTVYPNLSDSFFCDETYDALYAEQAAQVDPEARADTVREMQALLYEEVPYVLTVYYDNLVAYRSDRWTGWQPQPEPDGAPLFQYGTYTYRSLEPVDGAGEGGGGVPWGAVAAGVGVVVVGGGVLLARSRRRSEDDVA